MFKKIKQLTTQVSILTEEIAKADLELLKYEAEYQEHSAALSDANSTVAKLQAQVGHAQVTARAPPRPRRTTPCLSLWCRCKLGFCRPRSTRSGTSSRSTRRKTPVTTNSRSKLRSAEMR